MRRGGVTSIHTIGNLPLRLVTETRAVRKYTGSQPIKGTKSIYNSGIYDYPFVAGTMRRHVFI